MKEKICILSIGNTAFVNEYEGALISGKELKNSTKFIWNVFNEDVTSKLERVNFEEDKFYQFNFSDDYSIINVREFKEIN